MNNSDPISLGKYHARIYLEIKWTITISQQEKRKEKKDGLEACLTKELNLE